MEHFDKSSLVAQHRKSFRMSLRILVCLFAAITMAVPVWPMGHEEATGPERVPAAILELPITIHAGTGTTHQKITTSSTRAQAFYDQGLSYLHSYVWIDAARSFHQALRLDPHLAMAFLGLADAYIGLQDVPSARRAWAKAKELEKYMNGDERPWLTIRDREIACLEAPSAEKDAAYRQSIDEAIKANPRDPWLLVQRGLAEEASPYTHGQASGASSLVYYKRALAIDPSNLAAFHYEIHAHENLGDVKAALDESASYARLAYAIPHAHHMRGHELMRMGRTEEAIQEFQKTNELEENHYHTEKIPAQYDWHHAHNLQLMALNYELLGEMSKAEQLLRQAFALPASTEFLAYNRRAWPEFLIGRGRYEEALAACRELAQSKWPMARLAAHSLAGEVELAMKRLDQAQQELSLAEQETQHLPANVAAVLPYPNALRAGILLRQGQTQQGESIYVKVAGSAVAMPGPDGWIAAIFVLESIARDARQAGDWELAQYAAEQMISHDPYYAGGHFAIGLVAQHAGETDGAREMFTEAERLWSHADPTLNELKVARQELRAGQRTP